MPYVIILMGLMWLVSGGLMTYQSYLYNRQYKELEGKGDVVVGKNRAGFFSERVNVFLAVDKKGKIIDATKMDNTAFLHKPRVSPLHLVVGKNLRNDSFEYSLLDSKVKEALRFASKVYRRREGGKE